MYKFAIFVACLFIVLFCPAQPVDRSAGPVPAQQLIVYPSAGALPAGGDFSVKARIPGQPWKDVPVYRVKVADGTAPAYVPRQSSMAYFDFSGRVEVMVSSRKGKIGTARLRPLSYAIQPEVSNNAVRFFLDKPRNISVELDGDIFNNLQLFAGAPPAAAPDKADSNTIYYGPGVHRVGTVHLTSGKNVLAELIHVMLATRPTRGNQRKKSAHFSRVKVRSRSVKGSTPTIRPLSVLMLPIITFALSISMLPHSTWLLLVGLPIIE